jgi:hypothetical protein
VLSDRLSRNASHKLGIHFSSPRGRLMSNVHGAVSWAEWTEGVLHGSYEGEIF